MKVRLIKHPEVTGTSNKFNLHGVSEVIVHFDDPCGTQLDTAFIKDLEVLIKDKWLLMSEAFKNHDLITDNENINFFEPLNEEERKKGYRLTPYDLAKLKAESFD